MFLKSNPVRSNKLRRSARGHPCTTRIPDACNGDSSTSVLAHPPIANGGMSFKASDEFGAIVCGGCHDCIDGRAHRDIPRELVFECWIRGHQETLEFWRQSGLVLVEGAA